MVGLSVPPSHQVFLGPLGPKCLGLSQSELLKQMWLLVENMEVGKTLLEE